MTSKGEMRGDHFCVGFPSVYRVTNSDEIPDGMFQEISHSSSQVAGGRGLCRSVIFESHDRRPERLIGFIPIELIGG